MHPWDYESNYKFRNVDGTTIVYPPDIPFGSPYRPYDISEKDLDTMFRRTVFGDYREEGVDVDIKIKRSYSDKEHIVFCDNTNDLIADRVLKTLSAVKGRLMLEIAPIRIKEIKCKITPEVRKNIMIASKKLHMFGKKRPIIARFDEYGNRLPDTINLDINHGITLEIVKPEDYGEFYLELNGMEFPDAVGLDDLPF